MTPKSRKLKRACAAICLSVALLSIFAVKDAKKEICKRWPAAAVVIHRGGSIGFEPMIGMFQVFRGRDFIPAFEWIDLQLEKEAAPVDLDWLMQFKVAGIKITRCTVLGDLTAMLKKYPGIFVRLESCDLSALSQTQIGSLHYAVGNDNILIHGEP